MTKKFTYENTGGYVASDIDALNSIYEHRISLIEQTINEDIDDYVSERVLADYDVAARHLPTVVYDRNFEPVPVVKYIDIGLYGKENDLVVAALVDIDGPFGVMHNVLVLLHTRWQDEQITQKDWQSPTPKIPADLTGEHYQHAPSGRTVFVVQHLGYVKYLIMPFS